MKLQGPKEQRTTGMLLDWCVNTRYCYEKQNGKFTVMKAGKPVNEWPSEKATELTASILLAYQSLMTACEGGVKVDSPEALEIVEKSIGGPYRDFAIAAFNTIKSDYAREFEKAPPPPRPGPSEVFGSILESLDPSALE